MMTEEKGSVIVSLLNISTSIENEVKSCVSEKRKLFNTSLMKHDEMKDSEAYIFSPIDVPEILKENLVSWVLFIRIFENKEIGTPEKYVLSLNIRNKKTGDPFSTLESEISKETWENIKEITKFYTTKM